MRLRKLLLRFGGKIQRVVTPGLRDSQYEYNDTLQRCITRKSRWLDLGCGHHSLGEWMVKEEAELLGRPGWVVGLDYEFDSVRRHKGIRDKLAGDVYKLPFSNGAFDVISANMVMEHLQHPEAALREIGRVLASGGLLIFHTPNSAHYQFRIAAVAPQWLKYLLVRWLEGRGESDVFPAFYRINTMDAIASVAAAAGYTVREIRMVNSSPETYMLGPLVTLELLLIRMLNKKRFEKLRSNVITVLQKRDAGASPQRETRDAEAQTV